MDPKPHFWFLENIDLSALLCPKKMDMASDSGLYHTRFRRGEYIYTSDQSADKVFFVSKGRVKIGAIDAEQKKEITLAILSEGEVFGELAIIGQSEHRGFAIAMEDTEICVIKREVLGSLLVEHRGLYFFFLKLFGSRKLEIEKRLESMVFKDSRSRIIEFLVDLVGKRGCRVGYEYVVRKFLTHQEIAQLTATSRQTVTTVLNELREKDILTFDRRRLLVRDIERLKGEFSG